MSEELIVRDSDGVLILTMNRPDRLNALNRSLHHDLNEALASAASRRDVGCVVLTGAGRGFCAGGDLKNIAERLAPSSDPAPSPVSSLERRIDMVRDHVVGSKLLHDMGKPTIAMINGACAGAGLSLAGACDLRFAAESAVFTAAFTKVGLSGDSGGSWFWTRILGTAKARRLYLLSERFDAKSALDFGLVHEVWPDAELESRTMEIARRLADGPRTAQRFCKEVLNAAEDGALEQVLDLEAMAMAFCDAALKETARAKAKAERDV
ncbi:MAG: enoyl-CoA hydratase/isomerase family protein [Caulobacteraceae bacterium]|nr:enoyl-CoA hydratase/isomerase family protein [Caulobacteraceae bacterium]